MSDLIDRGAFILEQCHNCDGCCELVECDCLNCTSEHRCEMIADLLAQPTIDAVEVVHGEWIEADDFDELIKGSVVCSNCGGQYQSLVMRNNEIEIRANKTPYCPNCGAKMDGEVKNDE